MMEPSDFGTLITTRSRLDASLHQLPKVVTLAGFNQSVLSLLMRSSFQVGVMVELERIGSTTVNCSGKLITLTREVSLPFASPIHVSSSVRAVWRATFGFGKSDLVNSSLT